MSGTVSAGAGKSAKPVFTFDEKDLNLDGGDSAASPAVKPALPTAPPLPPAARETAVAALGRPAAGPPIVPPAAVVAPAAAPVTAGSAAPKPADPDHTIEHYRIPLPRYINDQLARMALDRRTSKLFLILTGLRAIGIRIEDGDMIEDGRRLSRKGGKRGPPSER